MADTLTTISTVSFAAAGFFLAVAVFFFFFFNIPSVYGDLSGLTAKRALAKRRAANEKAGVIHIYEPSKRNKARGKTTDAIRPIDPAEQKAQTGKGKKQKNRDEKKEPLFVSPDDRPETGLLNENRSDVSPGGGKGGTDTFVEQTSALSDGEGSATTELLEDTVPPAAATRRGGGVKLTILDSVVLVHTDEVIK